PDVVGSALLAVLSLRAPARSQAPLPLLPSVDTPGNQDPKDKADKQDKQDQPQPGVKVLDRGPIHEAFAQPGADVRGKGMTAPKAPPPPIPEIPPDTKPEGANVKWIPGYWMWDANMKDFIWVSGLWRGTPPPTGGGGGAGDESGG